MFSQTKQPKGKETEGKGHAWLQAISNRVSKEPHKWANPPIAPASRLLLCSSSAGKCIFNNATDAAPSKNNDIN